MDRVARLLLPSSGGDADGAVKGPLRDVDRDMNRKTTMQRTEPVRRRSVMLDAVVFSFVVLLVGCGGGGGGGADPLATGGGAAAASTGVGTISGTVIDGTTGAPVSAANVTAG